MELFFRNPGIALVREKILKGVWGENYFGDVKIVDVNIRRLRMKVEDEPSHPTHILTVWGYGYRWKNEKRDHPPVAAGQPAHHRAAGAAGRNHVPVQLHTQLL